MGDGLIKLANALKVNKTLIYIRIACKFKVFFFILHIFLYKDSKITIAGITEIAKALKINNTLKHFDIGCKFLFLFLIFFKFIFKRQSIWNEWITFNYRSFAN